MHLLEAVSQLGVLLLVGITAAQLDSSMVLRRGATAVRISLAGLLVPLAFGVGLGLVLPDALLSSTTHRAWFAAFLGIAMSVSAIPVIAKVLTDMHLLHRDVGQLTLAAGTVDDAVGWFLLSVISAVVTSGVRSGRILVSLACLLVFLAAVAVVGRPLLRLIVRPVARSGDPGPAVATAVIVILLGAAATQALGFEPVFGAFVAGVTLGSAHVIDPTRLAPLRTVVLSVLAPIFLATAGLRMDLNELGAPVVLLSGAAVLVIAFAGKYAGAYIGARASRLSRWEALALGAGMNARGVIEVIVALVGLRLGVLTPAMYTVVVLVAVVTSLMAPPLLRVAMARVDSNAEEQLRAAALSEWSSPAGGPPR
jgi:Kef-type K+ transport system membrane component KefB